jgi:hypothetical protein
MIARLDAVRDTGPFILLEKIEFRSFLTKLRVSFAGIHHDSLQLGASNGWRVALRFGVRKSLRRRHFEIEECCQFEPQELDN